MRFQLLLISTGTALLLGACGGTQPVEENNGVFTDRFSVDKEGRKHGEFRRFFTGDTLAELSHYVHGLLDGERTIYDKSGQPEIVEHYVMDTLQGPYLVYYPDGQTKISGSYNDGIMLGIWKRFYANGQLLEEVTYADNVENGPFTEYYENGQLKAQGHYLDGDFEQDTLRMYNQSGVLERVMLCDHGICNTIWKTEDGEEG